MKKILILLALLVCPQLAFAQSQRNPCYYLTTSSTGCQSVTLTTPLPVTSTASGTTTVVGTTSNASSGQASTSTSIPTASYNYGYNGSTWDQLQVDSNKNLLTSNGGAPSISNGANVQIASSSTSAVAARTGRRHITITNRTGTAVIDCAGTVATISTGQFIPAVIGASFTFDTTAQIFCISEGATQTVSILETY
jgi:hypothetical protein